MNEYMPLLREIFQAAPVTVIVMIVAGLGFWAGRSSQAGHIATLQEWITYLRDGTRHPSLHYPPEDLGRKLPHPPKDYEDKE